MVPQPSARTATAILADVVLSTVNLLEASLTAPTRGFRAARPVYELLCECLPGESLRFRLECAHSRRCLLFDPS